MQKVKKRENFSHTAQWKMRNKKRENNKRKLHDLQSQSCGSLAFRWFPLRVPHRPTQTHRH